MMTATMTHLVPLLGCAGGMAAMMGLPVLARAARKRRAAARPAAFQMPARPAGGDR